MSTILPNHRRTLLLAALVIAGACTADQLVAPSLLTPAAISKALIPPGAGPVLISQVYGGGGNAGANLKND